jgi:hypothetical protein
MQSFLRTPFVRVLGEPEHRAADELPDRASADGLSMNRLCAGRRNRDTARGRSWPIQIETLCETL